MCKLNFTAQKIDNEYLSCWTAEQFRWSFLCIISYTFVGDDMEGINFGNQEIKIIDRSNINISGVNKIVSFDDEEFLMETIMGNIRLLGEGLELLKLDTNDGNVKIKGHINSLTYIDGNSTKIKESVFNKLFK